MRHSRSSELVAVGNPCRAPLPTGGSIYPAATTFNAHLAYLYSVTRISADNAPRRISTCQSGPSDFTHLSNRATMSLRLGTSSEGFLLVSPRTSGATLSILGHDRRRNKAQLFSFERAAKFHQSVLCYQRPALEEYWRRRQNVQYRIVFTTALLSCPFPDNFVSLYSDFQVAIIRRSVEDVSTTPAQSLKHAGSEMEVKADTGGCSTNDPLFLRRNTSIGQKDTTELS